MDAELRRLEDKTQDMGGARVFTEDDERHHSELLRFRRSSSCCFAGQKYKRHLKDDSQNSDESGSK